MRVIHFDNIRTRADRVKNDNFGIMREMFEYINSKFKKMWEPSPFLCIDEQLFKFRGRVRFKVYIPSKPAKYGLKVWAIVDVGYQYVCNLEPYVGKQPVLDRNGDPNTFNVCMSSFDLVMRMMNGLTKPGRSLTGDNWFTSLPLVKKLLELDTTYVGTIRKNKVEIPLKFQASNQKEEYSSMFGFSPNITLVSYVPKKTVL